jgi:hypothetical protein
MKTTVNDVMTTRVIWVKKDATFRHVQGVVAVRDRLSYPDVYPVVAGPVFCAGFS